MTEHLWLVYAVLSAVMAALVSIFGKIGLQGLDADPRRYHGFVFDSGDGGSAQFRACRRNFGGPQGADFYHFERYGRRNVVAVLFCGAEVRSGFASGAGGQTQRGYCLGCRRRVSGREPVDAFRFRDCPDYGRNNYGGAWIKSARNLHEKP